MALLSKLRGGLQSMSTNYIQAWLNGNYKSQRKFEENEAGRSANAEINRKLYECPCCYNIPQPPIFMCNSGHNICSTCRAILSVCPTCDSGYDGVARNFLLEKMVESQDFPCRFHHNGCTETMKGSALKLHEDSCLHRDAVCHVLGTTCNGDWAGSIRNLYGHLVVEHGMTLVFRNKQAKFVAALNADKSFAHFHEPHVLLKVVDGRNYILRATFDKDTDAMFLYLTALYRIEEEDDDGDDDVQYNAATCELRLACRPQADLGSGDVSFSAADYSWIGPVNSLDDKPSKILEERAGLLISWENLLPHSSISEGKLSFQLHVNIYPFERKAISSNEKPGKLNFWSIWSKLPEPVQKSPWIVIAPIFTLSVMLYFIIFV